MPCRLLPNTLSKSTGDLQVNYSSVQLGIQVFWKHTSHFRGNAERLVSTLRISEEFFGGLLQSLQVQFASTQHGNGRNLGKAVLTGQVDAR